MAISKGHRFEVPFDVAFPMGLVLIGDVAPDTEYQSREDRASGRPVRQRVDETTGKRQWKATVTDPDEPHGKRASFDITFLADVQPVPTTPEVLPGMRQIELDGLTAEPRVAGTGEFKYQSYAYRSTGFRAAGAGASRGKVTTPESRPVRHAVRQGRVSRVMDTVCGDRSVVVSGAFPGSADRSPCGPEGSARTVDVPGDLVEQWTAAYRSYGEASEVVAESVPGDRQAASVMASASWEVAAAYRELAVLAGFPWWVTAAVSTAAQAFEDQGRDWTARASAPSPTVRRGGSGDRSGIRRVPSVRRGSGDGAR